jgi:hypothetical protein
MRTFFLAGAERPDFFLPIWINQMYLKFERRCEVVATRTIPSEVVGGGCFLTLEAGHFSTLK